MRSQVHCILLTGLAAVAAAQTPSLPGDIDPRSLSRLPVVARTDLKTDQERAVFDYIVGPTPRPTPLLGPGGISLHSPGSAEPIQRLNQYLRNESVIKGKLFELCSLVGAWEIEQQYEWSGHEPAALRAGVSQKAVDVVKFNRPVEGLDEQETVVIQMGRQILRNHKLDSGLYAHAVRLFGDKGTLEIAVAIGDYVLAGIMLITADQQLPPERAALLPKR